MATISVSDIRPAGFDLFSDDEKYMNDLSDNELGRVVGGTLPVAYLALGVALYIASQQN